MKNKLLTCLLLLSLPLSATHLRCGYISVEVLNSTTQTCRITVTVFTDLGSTVLFGGDQDILNFGDGTLVLVPQTPNTPRPDLGPDVGMASFMVMHTYPGPGNYTISYLEPNRNEGILNIENAVGTTFYLETTLSIDGSLGNFSTPEFLVDPFFTAQLGADLSLSVGAVTQDDYILSYELGTPLRDLDTPVSNYQLPENIHINPFNGVITWDTKFQDHYLAGEYLFVVKIHVNKVIDGSMYRICTMSRDIQIILVDDEVGGKISDNREMDENNRIYIPENETTQLKIFYEVTTPTSLTAYSELLENEDVFSFTTYDSSTNENIKVGVLTLTNHSSILRDSPYQITVRGKDDFFGSDIGYLFYTKDIYPQIITGVDDELPTVELFPNPTNDFITISLPENYQGRVKIYTQTGKLITESFIEGETSIDLRNSPSGFYYCQVQLGIHFKTIKVIKY